MNWLDNADDQKLMKYSWKGNKKKKKKKKTKKKKKGIK